MKPILCLDFDGVLHSYSSGWQGADVVSDQPTPGAVAFLREAVKHFRVAIFSSRSHQPGGEEAMRRWLGQAILDEQGTSVMDEDPPWFTLIEWPHTKPSAMVSIDDRALTFTGVWPEIADLLAFSPWNRKPQEITSPSTTSSAGSERES